MKIPSSNLNTSPTTNPIGYVVRARYKATSSRCSQCVTLITYSHTHNARNYTRFPISLLPSCSSRSPIFFAISSLKSVATVTHTYFDFGSLLTHEMISDGGCNFSGPGPLSQ